MLDKKDMDPKHIKFLADQQAKKIREQKLAYQAAQRERKKQEKDKE